MVTAARTAVGQEEQWTVIERRVHTFVDPAVSGGAAKESLFVHPVTFASIAGAKRVVITVQNPPLGFNGGYFFLRNGFDFTSNQDIAAGAGQLIDTSPDWTNGTTGTQFERIGLLNKAGNGSNWTARLVTIEWQE